MQLAKMLDAVKDDASESNTIIDLLHSLQQQRGPLIEVVTVLKFEKPKLYHALKNRVKRPGLKMLFELSFDYEIAKKAIYVDDESANVTEIER